MNKTALCALLGALGGAVSAAFGGWDAALNALIIFMGIDYVMGLVVAGVFHASNKSESGALDSRAGWKGLVRKLATLTVVLVAHWLDVLLGTGFIRDAATVGFAANEALSILENAALMGVPIDKLPVLKNSLEVLRKKSDGAGGA